MPDTSAQSSAPEPVEHPKGGHFTWLLWLAFLVLVVYPLGIGPAVKLHLACPALRPAIEAIYKPITLMMSHNKSASIAGRWYLEKVWGEP